MTATLLHHRLRPTTGCESMIFQIFQSFGFRPVCAVRKLIAVFIISLLSPSPFASINLRSDVSYMYERSYVCVCVCKCMKMQHDEED